MRHWIIVSALLALAVTILAGDKEHDWKTGKVLDSQLAKSWVPVGETTVSSTTETTGVSTTRIDFANIRDNQLVIIGDEFAYVVEDTRVSGGHGLVGITAHAIANRKHGCRFIVGDDVKYWQDRAILHVVDADGKECKADVIRQERIKPN